VIYFDSSAFVKLVWQESESAALADYVQEYSDHEHVSSSLLVIEVRRAALRDGGQQLPRIDIALDRIGLIDIGHGVLEVASRIPEPSLRSLDAIHLATALILGTALEAFITYDARLASAATANGITAVAPR
jgi:hypothetical protein